MSKAGIFKVAVIAIAALLVAFVSIPQLDLRTPDWYLSIGFSVDNGRILKVSAHKLDGHYYKKYAPSYLKHNLNISDQQTYTKLEVVDEGGNVLSSMYLSLMKKVRDLHSTDEEFAKMPDAHSGAIFKLHPKAHRIRMFYRRELQHEILVDSLEGTD